MKSGSKSAKSRLPLFSEVVGVDIKMYPNVVLIKSSKKAPGKTVPMGVLAAASMLRHALQWATMHHVIMRAVFNLDDRFVCYVIHVTNGFVYDENNDNGLEEYIKQVGFQRDKKYDYRSYFRDSMGLNVSEVRNWKWRVIKHKSARR